MKTYFLIKRKGFNYYTDYIELYLHRSFEKKGYFLVKEKKNSVFSVMVYGCEDEKYMAVASPFFDTLSNEETHEIAELLHYNFKSEVKIMPCSDDYELEGNHYTFMFSNTHNAFEEDAYVYDSEPEFVQELFSPCISYQPCIIGRVNYGGAFKGLDITLTFESDGVELEETVLICFKGKKIVSEKIVFEKLNNKFKCVIPDFSMDKGINRYSAVLKGKHGADKKSECSFYIRFIPKSTKKILNPEVIIKPL